MISHFETSFRNEKYSKNLPVRVILLDKEKKRIVQKPNYCNISQKRHSRSLRKNSQKKKKFRISNKRSAQGAQRFQALKRERTRLSDTRSIMPAQLGNERGCARRQPYPTNNNDLDKFQWPTFPFSPSFFQFIHHTYFMESIEYARQIRDTKREIPLKL